MRRISPPPCAGSIASGVAAITSGYPSMQPATVWIGVGVIVILLARNLRGVGKAGAVFAVPTYYAFIAAIAAWWSPGWCTPQAAGSTPSRSVTWPCRYRCCWCCAFTSGATAMTGLEASSNAVPSFEPTEWRKALIMLSWMSGLLIAIFGGVLVITGSPGSRPWPARPCCPSWPALASARRGLHLHPGGHRGCAADGSQHLLQRLPAGAVPGGP
jgi:amino acid transporter